jgi:ribosomal protein S18 acetylase RimI-like enzyme
VTADVQIRLAAPQDAAALAELAAVSFRAAYSDGQQATTERYIADHYGPDKQAAELADRSLTYLVVELDTALIGFAMFAYGESHPAVAASRPIRLSRIYVAPAAIGSGIGGRLMERCIDHASERRHDVMWLSVWEQNARAVAFYERWGFAMVGEMTFDYAGDPQRDFVMARSLADWPPPDR